MSAPRTIVRTVLIVVGVLVGLYILYLLRKPLSWVFIAGFVAIALSGPVNWLSRRVPRGLAILLTYLGLILVPLLLLAVLVPPIVRGASDLADHAPQYVRDVSDFVNKNETLRKLDENYGIISTLEDEAKKLPGKIGSAASTLGDVGLGIVNSVFALVSILILSVFLDASGRRWIDKGLEMVPPDRQERLQHAVDRIGTAVGGYVAGALVQATIAGVTTFIVLTILGVPFAAPLAVATAFFDLIPLVGATIAAILVGIVTLFHDFPTATIVWVIWAIVYQQIENSVIQPQIQRRAVEVHPFVVLVSVLFGATLFGIVGALVAIPIAASIQITIREYWDYRREVRTRRVAGAAPLIEPPT
jgi:predicted PurR-regulated permease PerM